MKIFTLLAHPENNSFNGALYRTANDTLQAAGHKLQTSNLYDMKFDPTSDRRNFSSIKDPNYFKQQIEERHATEMNGFAPDVETEIAKVEWCDLMIWQFPLWWFSVPGILKGWVDRVFAMGRTYGGGRVYDSGVFRGKRALLSLTTGGSEDSYLPNGRTGDIYAILRPVHRGMLYFVGFDVLDPHIIYGPIRKSQEERQAILEQYALRLQAIETEQPIDIGRY